MLIQDPACLLNMLVQGGSPLSYLKSPFPELTHCGSDLTDLELGSGVLYKRPPDSGTGVLGNIWWSSSELEEHSRPCPCPAKGRSLQP